MKHLSPAIILVLIASLWAQSSPNPRSEQNLTSAAFHRPRIGLVLEGGGALGFAHVGVIDWLEKNRIPVDLIAGTSMGGLVGGVYATGKTPEEMKELIRSIHWDEVLRGIVPYQDLSFRRKEDRRDYPNAFEFGLKQGAQFPSGFNSGQQVGLILDRVGLDFGRVSQSPGWRRGGSRVCVRPQRGDARRVRDRISKAEPGDRRACCTHRSRAIGSVFIPIHARSL